MRSRLPVPEFLYVQPLLFGLNKPDSPFDPSPGFPSTNAVAMNERTDNIRCAFLSPIDYARHGAEFCVVPGIGVSSSRATGTVRLLLRSDVRSISTVAVDIRVTSEIILAKIILLERYRSAPSDPSALTFIPMLPDASAMLAKADAALIVSTDPLTEAAGGGAPFALDLVEEWEDLTNLPYVHGFWVGREEELSREEASALRSAAHDGTAILERLSGDLARSRNLSPAAVSEYLDAFTYTLGENELAGLEEFIRYAYFHGAIPDVPDIQFFDTGEASTAEPAN